VIEAPFRVIERHCLVTPLGVRFLDDFSGGPVADGLEVWTWPDGMPQLRVPLRPAGSASYAAHHLPGFRELGAGAGDESFWRRWLGPEHRRTFVIDARDRAGRFLPVQARVDLPVRGFVHLPCAAALPAGRRHGVPLFSASTRSVPATAAVVRAQLLDRSARRPASWAMVDLRLDGRVIARGMADRDGRVVLLFPYPEPQSAWVSSPAEVMAPSSPPRLPLEEQRWELDLEVRYERTAVPAPVPDLCEALAQPAAEAVADDTSPTAPLTRLTLRYGERMVLRTANTAAHERGWLVVTTGGSPL
jgi:hypothetical protein